MVVYTLCVLVQLGCVVYAAIQLRRPGLNRFMRMQFLKHSLCYSGVAIVSYCAYLGFDIYTLVVFGKLENGQDNLLLDFIVEAIIPLFNFIFFAKSNGDVMKCLKAKR
jgi:hypothetical protein